MDLAGGRKDNGSREEKGEKPGMISSFLVSASG